MRGRQRFRFFEAERQRKLMRRFRACQKIQMWRRCLLAKWRTDLLREHLERRQALERATAIHIQAKIRTFCTRRVYRIMRRKYDARMRIALFCQCACRLRKSQIVVYVAAAEGRHRKEVNAVCCIQRMYRCRAARDEYAKRKQAYMEYLACLLYTSDAADE